MGGAAAADRLGGRERVDLDRLVARDRRARRRRSTARRSSDRRPRTSARAAPRPPRCRRPAPRRGRRQEAGRREAGQQVAGQDQLERLLRLRSSSISGSADSSTDRRIGRATRRPAGSALRIVAQAGGPPIAHDTGVRSRRDRRVAELAAARAGSPSSRPSSSAPRRATRSRRAAHPARVPRPARARRPARPALRPAARRRADRHRPLPPVQPQARLRRRRPGARRRRRRDRGHAAARTTSPAGSAATSSRSCSPRPTRGALDAVGGSSSRSRASRPAACAATRPRPGSRCSSRARAPRRCSPPPARRSSRRGPPAAGRSALSSTAAERAIGERRSRRGARRRDRGASPRRSASAIATPAITPSRWSTSRPRRGEPLALDAEQIARLRTAALLHDIGKVGVPDEILHKPGPLDEREWEIMRQHPVIGERIIRAIPGHGLDRPHRSPRARALGRRTATRTGWSARRSRSRRGSSSPATPTTR